MIEQFDQGRNTEAAKQEIAAELKRLGLHAIEGTDFYKGKGFLLSIDGSDGSVNGITPLSEGKNFGQYEYFTERTLRDIADIAITPSEYDPEQLNLVITSPTGYQISCGIEGGGSRSGGSDEKIVTVDNIEDRLLDQGFTLIASDETGNLYQFVTSKGVRVILSISPNRLEYVGFVNKSALPREDLIFHHPTGVTAYRKRQNEDYHQTTTPVLQLENSVVRSEVEINSTYLRLLKTDFTGPVIDELFPLTERDAFVQPTSQEGTMGIGTANPTEIIKSLQEINGKPIDELEQKMRPGKDSNAGFLGDKESLIETLAHDNNTVLGYGVTHQDLARKLFTVTKLLELINIGSTFEYNGQKLKVQGIFTKGMQFSPFGDNTGSSFDIILTNLISGKTIKFSALHPHMISRYGFYEGKGTSYRLEPEDIIDIFGIENKTQQLKKG